MKQLILILLLSLAVPTALFGQGDNYYYKYRQQKLLRKDNGRVSVKFTGARSIQAVQLTLASTAGFDLAKAKEVGVGVFTLPLQQGVSAPEARERLLSTHGIVSVQPVYITKDEGAELYLTDAISVQFLNGTSPQDIDRVIRTHNLTVRRTLDVEPYYLFSVPKGADVLEVANQIALENNILFSHPDFYTDALIKLYVPNDRWFDRQFNLYNHGQRTRWGVGTPGADIKMIQAWDITRGSSSILVSVLDDGLDLLHEDISSSKIVPGYDFADGDPSVQPVGENAHGTNTSGAIAADHNSIGNAGISPNSRLQMMKIFTDAGGGTTGDNLAWAIDSARISGADVMSNSWGYSSSDTNLVPAVRQAIIRAKTLGRGGKGCVITFAAGNTADRPGNVGIITFPGSMSEVITVGASDRNDQVAFYSPNSNPAGNLFVELTAPSHRAYDTQVSTEGFEFWSTDISGSAGYNAGTTDTLAGDVAGNYDGSMGGTSAACPQVAGAAALVLAVNPNLTSDQVTNLLTSTADTVGGYNYHAIPGRPGASLQLGYGRMNVYRALVQSGANFGWVKGTITNVSGGAALAGVSVDFTDPIPQASGTSSASGLYYVAAQVDTPGNTRNVTLRARKFGFRDTLIAVTITRNDTVTRNFAMTPVPNGTLVVRTVRTDSSNIRAGINILFNGGSVATGFTDSLTGLYSTILPLGSYDVLVDPPTPYGNRRFNGVSVASGSNPLYVVVRKIVENSPAAMRDTLAVGQVHAKTLQLTNTSIDPVPYRLTDDNALAKFRVSKPAVQPRAVPINAVEAPKGAAPTVHGNSPLGSGGPDAFGYRWIDSDEPGGPVYNWVEISTVGTAITGLGDDTNVGPFPVGFSFPFYGNNYNTFRFCSNGWISFTSSSTAYTNGSIPSSAEPNNAIYPFWDDHLFSATNGGRAFYYYDAANTQLIVQYDSVPHYGTTEPGTYTYQMILRPNGEIVAQYRRMVGTLNSATIGVENADGTVALQVADGAAYVHDNLALKFYLPDAGWISEAPFVGTIPASSTANITVTFDANGLTQGTTYNANIIMDVTHPDVVGSSLIPASLRVIQGSGPVISINPTSLTFPTTIIGNNRRDSVRVRNVGDQTLNITSVTTTNPRYAATASSSSIAAGDSARVRVVYTPVVPAGTDTGRVIILSNDPANTRVDVILTGTSIGAPLFRARVDSLVRPAMQSGTLDSIRFYVRNAGTAAGNYAARAIMIPRSGPEGSPSGDPIVVPMKLTPVVPEYPRGSALPSAGHAPRTSASKGNNGTPVVNLSSLVGERAFGYEYFTAQFTKLNLSTPGTVVPLGAFTTADNIFAGGFNNDFSEFYAIKGATNQLIKIDTSNGSYTVVGTVTPASGESWTALKFDPTDGTLFATSTNITQSTLYTINPASGATTVVGTMTPIPSAIAMALSNTGEMYAYGLDDNFYSVNKATGAATLIGLIGFDANFAQDMDFDRTSNTLYMAAYNNGVGLAELRTVNLSTGASTLIGQIGGVQMEMDPFAIKGGGSGPSANWLSIVPTSGGPMAVNDSTLFTARFDASSPVIYNNPGNYLGSVEVTSPGSPAPDTLKLPVRMFVVPSAGADLVVTPDSVNIGNVEIGRTDSSKTVLVKNIGASTLTVTNVTFTGASGFSSSRTSFTLPSLDTVRIKVKFTAAAPGGVRTARMNFTSNDPTAQSVGLRAVSLGVPHWTVAPDTFFYALTSGGADTTRSNFKLKNIGTDTLHYKVEESNTFSLDAAAIERSITQQQGTTVGKGAHDPTPGQGGIDAQGGPDAFGYRWIDSDEPGGPAFNWVDISGIGTALSMGDDDNQGPFPLGFNVSFYGTSYNTIRVCSNGWVSFTSTSTAYSNVAIPAAAEPNNAIYPFWDDMDATLGGTIHYYADAANSRFIVQWTGINHYGTTEPGLYTYQVIVKANGDIITQYLDMQQTLNSATIGIENAGGTVALQTVFDAAYIHNNLAVLFTQDAIPWMSTDKVLGTVAPGDSTTIQLRVHPHGLAPGNYLGYQKITGNGPDTARVRVRLNFTVGITENQSEIPTVFALSQNYPNPFNPTTKIKYDLPEQAQVTLKIYNVLGQVVATLANGPQVAGRYEATWDGRNNFGNQVSSGVYFYRFEATSASGQSFANLKKMLFLK